jgi:hypothetical protein
VLVAHMLQHGTRRLRATAAEPVIELVDALGMRALVAGEGHASPASSDPVDRVHHARAYPLPFPPDVKIITFLLPSFERERARTERFVGVLLAAEEPFAGGVTACSGSRLLV